ncbi:response regulator transcription factor [Mucilaginibacter sp. HC2]|uniref:LytR/AlgR family response regulator transcription factor n=1 Tax=Mucilaginibacter inviolabilis TaxID=2714892 RepID=UPI00140BB976|nr:LytTR family DNA-binding domain-containing protein [Mucilaginibacter inviolabilis]NHA05826.1 response regulator transcription factor [Mucilaginibacter inviolabilis]
MIKCIIVDDEQHAIDILLEYTKDIPWLNIKLATTDPLELIAFLHNEDIDLVFLDINMPKLSGIDLLKLLNISSDGPPFFVLTTAYSKYALDSYEYGALDYLMKPISLDRFLKTVNRVQNLLNKASITTEDERDSYFFVKVDTKNKMIKVNNNDILYIEGLKNYVTIYTIHEKIVSMLNMKDLEERLRLKDFIRVHRSYIIPVKRIKKIDGNRIFLDNITGYIPLGLSYKLKFANFLLRNSFK